MMLRERRVRASGRYGMIASAVIVACCYQTDRAQGDSMECWRRGLISEMVLGFEPDEIVFADNKLYFYHTPTIDDWGIVVYDVSDPAQPVFLGDQVWPGRILDFEVVGSFAYATAIGISGNLFEGVRIIEVSDPSSMAQVGDFKYQRARQIFVQDNVAYVGTDVGHGQLLMVNVADAQNPSLLGTYNSSAGQGDIDVFDVKGNVVFGFGISVDTFNISNPSNIRHIGDLRTVFHADVLGNYLYCTEKDGLSIRDATNARVMAEYVHLQLPEFGPIYAVPGFVCFAAAGIPVIDVADPLNPTMRGRAVLQHFQYTKLALSGNICFAVQQDLLSIFDIAAVAGSSLIGAVEAPDSGPYTRRALKVKGNYAYVASSEKGMRIYDVTDPANPIRVVRYDTPGFTLDLDVLGDIACLADEVALEIVDVSDPLDPAPLATLDVGAEVLKVRMEGSNAFIGLESGEGVRSLDLSDPTTPFVQDQYIFAGGISDLEVDAGRLYIASVVEGLYILDVTDPTDMTLLSHMPGQMFNTIDVSGGVLCGARAAFGDGLRTIDVSDPSNPVLLSTFDPLRLNRPVRVLTIEGNVVYAAGSRSVFKIDVSDLSNPVLTGYANHGEVDFAELVGDALLGLEETTYLQWRTIGAGVCAFCPADIAAPSGNVDVNDLFLLLANWNTSGPGANLAPPTNIVDVSDLFALLAGWGGCP